MTPLGRLRVAASLHDVAAILGYKPSALAYILYKKRPAEKYTQFSIPKRGGGTRTISAPYPQLMHLQRRLSNALQDCMEEIAEERKIENSLSHGFRRGHSIVTNASQHRGKRYVFNVDITDFFGAINFGRVRGFFINDRNFALADSVATVLAQIACHGNKLPQGSPCSPVISNLIGHIMDIHLAALAERVSCDYSRYADDLTFSTNERLFPAAIAESRAPDSWAPGRSLIRIVDHSGFALNIAKTRMQYCDSRQMVTGLVTNAKVNAVASYRRNARAMAHRLFTVGHYERQSLVADSSGSKLVKAAGTSEQLRGVLNFIYSVRVSAKPDLSPLDPWAKLYGRFISFTKFYRNSIPIILCEGKTDYVYIKTAIQRLASSYPQLADVSAAGRVSLRVGAHRYSKLTKRVLNLGGGIGDLKNFLPTLHAAHKSFKAPGLLHPLIILVDSDEAAKPFFACASTVSKSKIDPKAPFSHLFANVYVVPIPLPRGKKTAKIEDLFPASILGKKLGGKKFSHKETFDPRTEYGKHFFAEYVVKRQKHLIDFKGFKPLLTNIESSISDYKLRLMAS